MEIFLYIIWFYFGAIIGSFLNVVILRLPDNQELSGRSRCVDCGHVLSPAELFPLFSFLFLGGKCKNCRAKISPRYFIIETVTGLLFALVWHYTNLSGLGSHLLFLRDLFVIAIFVPIFVIDLEHYLILDKIVFPAMIFTAMVNFILSYLNNSLALPAGYFISGLIGAAAAGLFFFSLWFFSKGKWMGFGDVKLALLLGFIFGWPLVAINIMLAVFLGALVALVLLVKQTKTLKSQIPFGTFLTFGGAITLFFGQSLLLLYLRWLGI